MRQEQGSVEITGAYKKATNPYSCFRLDNDTEKPCRHFFFDSVLSIDSFLSLRQFERTSKLKMPEIFSIENEKLFLPLSYPTFI